MSKIYKYTLRALIILIIMSTAYCSSKEAADLIIKDATIYTVDSNFSTATAFAVKSGKFVAVGEDEEILKHYKSDNIIDAAGFAIYPGFLDGHCHFKGMGENTVRYADLTGCKSFDEVIERLKIHFEKHPSDWLLGRGWDQNLWKDKTFPTNERLDEVFAGKKVVLTRIDGHAGLVSKEVMSLANFDSETKIDRGEIIKDKDGKCTGLLVDKPYDIVRELVPKLEREELIRALKIAEAKCLACGLTGVTDAGLELEDIKLIDSLQQSGFLKLNFNIMINPDERTMDYFMKNGIIKREGFSVRSIKIYADGALGSRGAKLIQPYSDSPSSTGIMVFDSTFYDKICEEAYNHGFQVCCHAIGDQGVRSILNIYAKYLGGKNDFRWRIEHSQVVNSEDFHLFKGYSIIPSIQSTHATSDMGWAVQRLGEERLKGAYAQKQLLATNGWIINGTDFPIEGISPLATFYAAVARKDTGGRPEGGFLPEEAFSREEALKSITIGPAKGYFAENEIGSIEVGKFADFVVLTDDIIKNKENDILKTGIQSVWIKGKQIY